MVLGWSETCFPAYYTGLNELPWAGLGVKGGKFTVTTAQPSPPSLPHNTKGWFVMLYRNACRLAVAEWIHRQQRKGTGFSITGQNALNLRRGITVGV